MEIIEELGSGSYGTVYLVKYKDEIYAMKSMIAKTKKQKKMYLKEIEILKYLTEIEDSYKYISCYRFKKVKNNVINIGTDYINGPTLKTYIKNNNNIYILDIMYQLLMGLKFLHDNGIIHRDIKTQNILVDGEICKFIDFGFSCSIYDEKCLSSIRGSPAYHSPEHYDKTDVVQKRSKEDIWSLGIVFYYCYYGKHPFDGKGKSLIENIRNQYLYELDDTSYDANIKYFIKCMLTKIINNVLLLIPFWFFLNVFLSLISLVQNFPLFLLSLLLICGLYSIILVMIYLIVI